MSRGLQIPTVSYMTNKLEEGYLKCTHPHLCNTAICYRQDRAKLIVPVHDSVELERERIKGSCKNTTLIIIIA